MGEQLEGDLFQEDQGRKVCVRACETFLQMVLRQYPQALQERDNTDFSESEMKVQRQKKRQKLIDAVARLWVLNEIGLEFRFSTPELDALVRSAITGDSKELESKKMSERIFSFFDMVCSGGELLTSDGSFATRVRIAALRLGKGQSV